MSKKQEETTSKKSFGKKVVQNLPFVNFDETPIFFGIYRNTLTLGDKEETKFDANVMVNMETGEEMFVTDSYSIKKGIEKVKENSLNIDNTVICIEYKGKSTNSKGQPLNLFEISADTLEAYQEYIK